MTDEVRTLSTRSGIIRFPAYIPVTTFGKKYPLDDLIRPYLPRLAQGVMVSYHYARQIENIPRMPLLVDSGGFVSLFQTARVVQDGKLGCIEVMNEEKKEVIHPDAVLALQEQIGDIAFTLDFPIPSGMGANEAQHRQALTIANALWALRNRRRRDMPLYACIQGWDTESVRACAKTYMAAGGFEGIALGGLVSRVHNLPLVLEMVKTVRSEIGNLPLHVFGLGHPDLVDQLYRVSVDTVDSSAYVKLAATGRLWSCPEFALEQPTAIDRLHLALLNWQQQPNRPYHSLSQGWYLRRKLLPLQVMEKLLRIRNNGYKVGPHADLSPRLVLAHPLGE